MTIRVLVVDDSAFARKVLRQVLAASTAIDVVGYARDGVEALEKIAELQPDVVTLDLVMPNLDGVGVMRALSARTTGPRPQVVLVTFSHEESDLVVEGLELGAVSMVRKPTAQATDGLYALSGEVVKAVIEAASARHVGPVSAAHPAPSTTVPGSSRVVVVGTSTGGPQALSRLLSDLPKDLPVPLLIALHIPGEYTASLARRLDQKSKLTVVEAASGIVLEPGMAILAKGGMHLRVIREGLRFVTEIDVTPAAALYHPSVDVLFTSAAEAYGAGTLGVVLTGMGDDGLIGSRAVKSAGGRLLTESESSCVVYGMPRSVKDAGLSTSEARIENMALEITRHL